MSHMTFAEQQAANKKHLKWGIANTVLATTMGIVLFVMIAKQLG